MSRWGAAILSISSSAETEPSRILEATLGKLRDAKHRERHSIRKDVADSRQAGARGTPIFYVGVTNPNSNELRVTRIIRGAHSYATFKETIDGLLSSVK